jgi:hypothetical protein
MSDERTPRLALPLLQPGQAQKETTHNEALTVLDLTVQASVLTVGTNVPPAVPLVGSAWIVGTAPTGGWVGQARAIAGWTSGGWRFVAPRDGMTAAESGRSACWRAVESRSAASMSWARAARRFRTRQAEASSISRRGRRFRRYWAFCAAMASLPAKTPSKLCRSGNTPDFC